MSNPRPPVQTLNNKNRWDFSQNVFVTILYRTVTIRCHIPGVYRTAFYPDGDRKPHHTVILPPDCA